MRSRVQVPVVLGLLLVSMSCGGSDSTPSADDTPAAEPSGASSPADEADAPIDDEADAPTESAASSSNSAAGTGTITIGDLSHELTMLRCVTMAGAISADGVSVSEPDNVDVSFSFSPEDWRDRPTSQGWTETGTARLDVDEPYEQWESGASVFEGFTLPAGTTAADFDITALDISDDGQSASGEATFVEINALLGVGDPVPTPGSFAFTCPES